MHTRTHTKTLKESGLISDLAETFISDYTNGYNWKNEPHGVGTARFKDGRVYHGCFSDGILDGENSTFTFPNGDYFEGAFKNNEFYHGKYTIRGDNSYFIGTFREGEPDKGKWYDRNGKIIY